jgi:hypothetical protein
MVSQKKDWETASMGDASQIDVTFDRKAFNIVVGTFSYMRDNWGAPGIIDPAAVFISPQEATDLIGKLRAADKGGSDVTVPMNFDDWVVYSALLSHTSSNIPQSNPDAYGVLEALWEDVGRRDDAGEAPNQPTGPKPVRG